MSSVWRSNLSNLASGNFGLHFARQARKWFLNEHIAFLAACGDASSNSILFLKNAFFRLLDISLSKIYFVGFLPFWRN